MPGCSRRLTVPVGPVTLVSLFRFPFCASSLGQSRTQALCVCASTYPSPPPLLFTDADAKKRLTREQAIGALCKLLPYVNRPVIELRVDYVCEAVEQERGLRPSESHGVRGLNAQAALALHDEMSPPSTPMVGGPILGEGGVEHSAMLLRPHFPPVLMSVRLPFSLAAAAQRTLASCRSAAMT